MKVYCRDCDGEVDRPGDCQEAGHTLSVLGEMLVYIAGPYTPRGCSEQIDAQLNLLERHIRDAVEGASMILERGHFPFIPHTHTNGFAVRTRLPNNYRLYLGWDKVILDRCDCIALLTWPPKYGYEIEWERAKKHGKLHFKSVFDVPVAVKEQV